MTWNFDQPGYLTDFSNPNLWHNHLASYSGYIISELAKEILKKQQVTQEELDLLRPEIGYADPTSEQVPADAQTIPIQAWGGFPRAVERRDWSEEYKFEESDPDGRYRAVAALGDEDYRAGIFVDRYGRRIDLPVRHRQDEYLEWSYSPDGRSLVFVTEGYDYYAALFAENEQKVVDLYKEFTQNDSLTADDLRAPDGVYRLNPQTGESSTVVKPGEFNPRNIHNIKSGIVHLSHRANSLTAEVVLAGTSAIGRTKKDNSLLSGNNAEELLCCNLGGGVNRNSDPIISQAGYLQVLAGKRYTLANPVGLYVAAVEYDSLLMPNNVDPVPREWWTATRGSGLGGPTNSRVLRLELRIPDGETYNGRPLQFSDLKVGGGDLTYSGQVAELVKVHLFVTAWDRPEGGIGRTTPCVGTCCSLDDSALLFPTRRPCTGDYQDKFPGLITSSSTHGMGIAHSFDLTR